MGHPDAFSLCTSIPWPSLLFLSSLEVMAHHINHTFSNTLLSPLLLLANLYLDKPSSLACPSQLNSTQVLLVKLTLYSLSLNGESLTLPSQNTA